MFGNDVLRGWKRETLGTLTDCCSLLANPSRQDRWVFRGERCGYPDCRPGVSRNAPPQSLQSELGEVSAVVLHPKCRHLDLDVALMVAQHHDLPTRLVDWSLDPMVALHFASAECSVAEAAAKPRTDLRASRLWCYDWVGSFPSLAAQWDRPGRCVDRKGNRHFDLAALIREGVPD